jgi:hypothetical protein
MQSEQAKVVIFICVLSTGVQSAKFQCLEEVENKNGICDRVKTIRFCRPRLFEQWSDKVTRLTSSRKTSSGSIRSLLLQKHEKYKMMMRIKKCQDSGQCPKDDIGKA